MTTHRAVENYRRAYFSSTWAADFLLRAPKGASKLIVLLHGFSQSGERIYRKLESLLPADAAVLAPCAPFPLPRVADSEPADQDGSRASSADGKRYELGYSWYFYDFRVDEYLIDPRIGVDFVVGLLKHLRLDHLPVELIGFSQGGYIAPMIGAKLPLCRRVIGIACEFLVDEMEFPVHFRMDQIHGETDDITDPAKAKRAHERLLSCGVSGEFREVAGLGHRIDGQVQKVIQDLYG